MYKNIDEIIKNSILEYVPVNSNLNFRSCIRNQIDFNYNSNNLENSIVSSVDEGISLRSKGVVNSKISVSNLDIDVLDRLIKPKDNKNSIKYTGSIRNINRSTIEEKTELIEFIFDSLKDKFEDTKISIKYFDSSEYKIYVDDKECVLHNDSYVFIQTNILYQGINLINGVGINLIHNKLKDIYEKIEYVIENFYHDNVERIKTSKIGKLNKSKSNIVILDPLLAGAFVHEIYGHSLESDAGTNLYKKLKIDNNLEIKDSPILENGIVNYEFDDEGSPAKENTLIKKGKVLSLIHNRESAEHFGINPTGNGRSESYGSEILPRMSNTMTNMGDWDMEEAISNINDGFYLAGFLGGGHNSLFNTYSLTPNMVFKITNGKIEEMVKNVYVTGSMISALKDVEIGKYQENSAAMCSKKNQNVVVGIVSPFLKIGNVTMICSNDSI